MPFLVSKPFEEYDLETTSLPGKNSMETITTSVDQAETTTMIEDNDDFYDYFNTDYYYGKEGRNNSENDGSGNQNDHDNGNYSSLHISSFK